jgi:predicted MFS family arabinose efflux permease
VNVGAARRATSAMFLICGMATSCWAPMIPFVKARLGLDEGTLGLILLTFGGGSMVAMPLAGVAIHVWGSRRVVSLASLATCAALPLLALPLNIGLVTATLFVFGAALGAMDVAMNAQALAVQHAAARPIMSGFHALFSVGGLAGAALLSLLLRAGAGLATCAAGIAVFLAILALSQQRHLVADHGTADSGSFTIVPKPAALLLGALCFMTFLGEGAVLDWGGVFLTEQRQVDVSVNGIGYAAFSVAMAVMRFSGDRIIHRAGPLRVLLVGGALAAAGYLAVAGIPSAAGTIAGFVIVGIGAANIVPILFTAAGRVPGVAPGIGLATVTTIGYAGLLVGPALIGFVADATSLQFAFVLVAAMFAAIAVSARRVS